MSGLLVSSSFLTYRAMHHPMGLILKKKYILERIWKRAVVLILMKCLEAMNKTKKVSRIAMPGNNGEN
jgi:hypothetical protein